ncbi:MAG: HAMP domain-containing protein [Chloroflexi bacterium]|nr:HAMP domain-containing protein [Chloroflexota bacterium]
MIKKNPSTARAFGQFGIRTRLTILILVITAPLLIGVVALINTQAASLFKLNSNANLRQNNEIMATNLSMWLDLNIRTLQEMVSLPDIQNMNANEQRPVLQAVAKAHPYMYLVSTTDLSGRNIARSDDADLTDYSDRYWFQNAVTGVPVTFQSLIGRTSKRPALVISVPIKNESGDIIGVGMFAADLADLSEQARVQPIGKTGFVFIIDAGNKVLAHPDPAYTTEELRDLSEYPPVAALRAGQSGLLSFTDEQGIKWNAYVRTIDNDWAIISQQQESEILGTVRQFNQVAIALIGAGVVVLLILSWISIRRMLNPIGRLTESVAAIAAGDLNRMVEVKSSDEIGLLASSFNAMTDQLRDLIGSLEQRVAERTVDLDSARRVSDKRAQDLQTIAEISQLISSEQELEVLLSLICRLVSEQFDFYHVGIFFIDETGRFAVLQASNSPGGKMMLYRGHRLEVGESSIVGYVAKHGTSRIALDVGLDAVFFNNPDLPETRSEMALPMHARGQMLGVLDVQSTKPGAFSDVEANTLGILSDQIAIAIVNARLFRQSQQALAEYQALYQERIKQGWATFSTETPVLGYQHTLSGGKFLSQPVASEEIQETVNRGSTMIVQPGPGTKDPYIVVPVKLRDQIIGTLKVQAPEKNRPWSRDEIKLANAVSERLSIALENARLIQESQKLAIKEQTISEVTSKIGESILLENVLKTAVEELGRAMPGSEVILNLQTQDGKAQE